MNFPIDPTPPSDPRLVNPGLSRSEALHVGDNASDSRQDADTHTAQQVTPAFTDPWAIPSQVGSWIVIVFCTGLMMSLVFLGQFVAPDEDPNPAALLVPANFTGQFALGVEPFNEAQAEEMLDGLDTGPIPQRLARLVILTELISGKKGPDQSKPADGPEEGPATRTRAEDILDALERLPEQMTEANYVPTETERELLDATEQVIRAKLSRTPLPADSDAVQTVAKELGFAGRVAAAWSSDDPKVRQAIRDNSTTKLVFVSVFGLAILAAVACGLLVAAGLVGSLVLGWLRSGLRQGSGYGFVHLEAFAVWFVSFFACQVGVGLMASMFGMGEKANVGLTLIIFYIPVIVALGWLVVRHPQPRRALQEVGFTTKNIWVDLGKAVITHLAFLPLLGLMMFLTVGLTTLVHGGAAAENPFAPPGGPSHPIQEQFDGEIGTVLLLFLLAAVTAPLVEETVFRGLMYRYLRDVTHQRSIYLSVLVATLVNGFIFASIHPQGLLGIPTLMTLAASMSLAREWSGGLIAPMAIHALNNGALVGLMSLMFAS